VAGLLHLPSGGVLHLPAAEAAAAPPVLFLHGVGGGAWSFGPQRAALERDFACYAWEGRGHGAARRVEDAGLADYHRDAQEALAEVHAAAKAPVLLVGHSMGSLLALALACEQPGAVRGLFLVDPVYAEQGDPPQVLTGLTLRLTRWVVGVLARSYRRDGWLSRALSGLVFRQAFSDSQARRRAWQAQRTQVPLEYPRMLFEAFEGVTGFPFRPFADELTAPTCVVEAAAEGRPSRFAALKARLERRLGPAFTFHSVRGGHYLQLDRPAEVSERLVRFAAGLGGA